MGDNQFVFLVSLFPIDFVEQLPKYIPVIRRWNPSYNTLKHKKIVILFSLQPSNIYSFYYYLLKIKKFNEKTVSRNNIVKIFPLYNKDKAITLYDKIHDQRMKEELKKYFTYSIQKFSDDMITLFGELKLHLPEPVKAFRGVLLHSFKDLQKAKLDKLTTGDVLTIDSRGFPLSWSTDSCLSQYFATHAPAKQLDKDSHIQFGVLYSCLLEPQQIAIDTRLIDRKYFFKELYWYDQQEIITFPYLSDKMNKFQCRVERLFLVNLQKKQKTIVYSFQKIVPLLLETQVVS